MDEGPRKAQPEAGPDSPRRQPTQPEAGGPEVSLPHPSRTPRPGRGVAASPYCVRGPTSSRLGRSGDPVPSVQILSPRPPRLTDPDPNPRGAARACEAALRLRHSGTRLAPFSCSSHPSDSAARQAAVAQARSNGRASRTSVPAPLRSTCILCHFLLFFLLFFPPPWAGNRLWGRACFLCCQVSGWYSSQSQIRLRLARVSSCPVLH